MGDYATAAGAVQIRVEGGQCVYAGIGLTNMGLTPIRAAKAEQALLGTAIDDAAIKAAASAAAVVAEPNTDYRGSEDYKRALVKTLTSRALHKALERAKG